MNIQAYGSAAAQSADELSTGECTSRRATVNSSAQQPAEDTTSFAWGVASVQALTKTALDTTSRAARVASLQQAVESGQYTVNPGSIASALSKADI